MCYVSEPLKEGDEPPRRDIIPRLHLVEEYFKGDFGLPKRLKSKLGLSEQEYEDKVLQTLLSLNNHYFD